MYCIFRVPDHSMRRCVGNPSVCNLFWQIFPLFSEFCRFTLYFQSFGRFPFYSLSFVDLPFILRVFLINLYSQSFVDFPNVFRVLLIYPLFSRVYFNFIYPYAQSAEDLPYSLFPEFLQIFPLFSEVLVDLLFIIIVAFYSIELQSLASRSLLCP